MVNVVLCCFFLFSFVNVSFQRDVEVNHAATFPIKIPRIVGGSNTDKNEYPWMVALCKGPTCGYNTHFCGGTLLTEKFIVTAAHCVKGMSAAQLSVSLGDHNLDSKSETNSQVYQIQKIIKHQRFNPKTLANDIALLKVKGKVKLRDNVRPACLPPKSKASYGNKITTVNGWGTIGSSGKFSKTLREVQVWVLYNKACRRIYGNEYEPGMLCAGSENSDSCEGDSGGPLVLKNSQNKWELIGIVSWGSACGSPGYPGVYTSVRYFLKWIKAKIGNIPYVLRKKCGIQ